MRNGKEGGEGKGGKGSGQALKILRPRAARGDATVTGVSGRNRRGGGSGGDGGGGVVVRLSCGDDDDDVGLLACVCVQQDHARLPARVRTGVHTYRSPCYTRRRVRRPSHTVADLGGVRGVRPHPPWRPSEKFRVYQF